jgi:hypothetical protein
VIGPQNRFSAYSPEIEQALLYTAAGQATYAVPGSPHRCGDCVHWRKSKAAGKGRCAEYARPMQGRQGAMLRAAQTACRAFQGGQGEGPNPPLAR